MKSVAFLDALGGGEILIIMLVVLLLFGGEKLPELARGLGRALREFRKAAGNVENEIKKAIEDRPEPTPPLDRGREKILPPPSVSPTGTEQRPQSKDLPGQTSPANTHTDQTLR